MSSFERSCPGLADSQFIEKHEEALIAVMGNGDRDSVINNRVVDTACRFNSDFQERFYNFDGTPKFPGLPPIPAFTGEQIGNLNIYNETASNSLITSSGLRKLEGQIILDPDNLGLPEIKINATSEENERNSFNSYATTEYLWTGDDETLEFQLNFDFFHSLEMWDFAGYESTTISEFLLWAFVSEDLVINPEWVFPETLGNILNSDFFSLSESDVGETSADDPYFGNLTVSFDVTAGQTFFVTAQYQGFAKNAGFLNAFNTVTGGLNVQNLTQEESLSVFEESLQTAPVNPVNSPATILLFMLGGILIAMRARKSLKTNV